MRSQRESPSRWLEPCGNQPQLSDKRFLVAGRLAVMGRETRKIVRRAGGNLRLRMRADTTPLRIGSPGARAVNLLKAPG